MQPCGATKDPCVYNMLTIEKIFIYAYCEISCNFYIPYSWIICFHSINGYVVCGALFFGPQHEIIDAHHMARKTYKQDIDGPKIQGGFQETMMQLGLKAKEQQVQSY